MIISINSFEDFKITSFNLILDYLYELPKKDSSLPHTKVYILNPTKNKVKKSFLRINFDEKVDHIKLDVKNTTRFFRKTINVHNKELWLEIELDEALKFAINDNVSNHQIAELNSVYKNKLLKEQNNEKD